MRHPSQPRYICVIGHDYCLFHRPNAVCQTKARQLPAAHARQADSYAYEASFTRRYPRGSSLYSFRFIVHPDFCFVRVDSSLMYDELRVSRIIPVPGSLGSKDVDILRRHDVHYIADGAFPIKWQRNRQEKSGRTLCFASKAAPSFTVVSPALASIALAIRLSLTRSTSCVQHEGGDSSQGKSSASHHLAGQVANLPRATYT